MQTQEADHTKPQTPKDMGVNFLRQAKKSGDLQLPIQTSLYLKRCWFGKHFEKASFFTNATLTNATLTNAIGTCLVEETIQW